MTQKIIEFLKIVVIAIILALIVKAFVFQPFHIPSGSMVPNLLKGDHLFVDKFSYGYSQHSFNPVITIKGFEVNLSPAFEGRYLNKTPERGDVIVFKYPLDPSQFWIKRLIGLPGDKIEMKKGRLYINGEMMPREFIAKDFGSTYYETFPNGHKHIILETTDSAKFDNNISMTVPEDHFFFMGDNRDNSNDSRGGLFIHRDLLIGKARAIFFSYDPSEGKLYEFWKWHKIFRWDRFFKSIQ